MVRTSGLHKSHHVSNYIFFTTCLILGCGGGEPVVSESDTVRGTFRPGELTQSSTEPQADAEPQTYGTDSDDVAGIDRKIIYQAQVRLVVPDFAAAEEAVPHLVKLHGGYLAHSSIDRTSGERRSGNWQARIPVEQFELFLDALSILGVPENRSQTAQDVTEEFVDLDARISNKRRLEERILELLEKADDKIKDVIAVERELARVRGEIEQMEGRLRFLTNHTDLTTVTIFAREQRDYVPTETPTFLTRTKQAWNSSLLALRSFGEQSAVVVVVVFPWLLALFIVAAPAIWAARRRKRQSTSVVPNETPANSTPVDEGCD